MHDEPERGGRFRAANGPAAVLLALAAVLGLLAGWVTWRETAAVERNTDFTIGLERLLSSMKDLETAQRGFLLTGDQAYLIPYNGMLPVMRTQLAGIQAMDLPIADLADLAQRRRTQLERAIDTYRTAGEAAAIALVQQGRGKAVMEALHQRVQALEAEADARIANHQRVTLLVALPLGIVAFVALVGAIALLVMSSVRRRRAQQASAALLEGVLDNAPVGLGFLDSASRIRRSNRALRKIGGEAKEGIEGLSLWELMPDLRGVLEKPLHRVTAGGAPVHNLEVEASGHADPSDDRAYQVSFYPLPRMGPHPVLHGHTDGVGIVVLDITDRKRSERRLRESEERFRTLTASVSSMVWITDGAGRFVEPQIEWTNFTGQPFEAHKDLGWRDAVHPADLPRTDAAWSKATAEREPYQIEHRLRRADGEWRYVAAAAVPILDAAGHVREWIGSHTDITERKQAEMELAAAKTAAESANRAKSVFLANMSHELRTPLSAVIGYSEMMEEEVEDLGIDALAADLGKIKANARHLLSLINDVLDLSKIEANRMDVLAEEVEVEPLLADVAATVQSLIAKKHNLLECNPGAALGRMSTDAVKLRQCLFNLLSNAAKFTEGGRIGLAAERLHRADGDWIVFRVSDTGIGMTPDQVDRLFQRFSQADETTTRKFGGTGLGLAITRAFSKLLGGDIHVESTLGVGTTFILELPVVMPTMRPVADVDVAEDVGAHPRGRELVLIIDDDAAQRDLMARYLERQGFATRTAPDGQTGLDLARSLQPRAILLDVMMPRMDGWSVLTALKADPETAGIPVVMVTFVHDTGMGAALGAADYVTKPVNWDTLKTIMERFRSAEGDVLIVDDDADARARLANVLERNGWTTQQAENGYAALDVVSRAVPRVILLDLTMPVMDGFSFLGQLRARPGCADVPVIVLTARDLSSDDRRRLVSAERVFSKGSVSLSEITREIRAIAPPASEPERAEEPSS